MLLCAPPTVPRRPPFGYRFPWALGSTHLTGLPVQGVSLLTRASPATPDGLLVQACVQNLVESSWPSWCRLVSQTRDRPSSLWYLLTCSPFGRSVDPIPGHRHRVVTQSTSPFFLHQLAMVRAPSLHGSYPASLLLCAPPTPAQATFRLCLPLGVGFHPPDGSPRFLCQSVDARCPQPPRMAPRLLSLILLPWITGFGTSDILGRPSLSVTRLKRVHLRYGSRLRLRRLRPPDCSESPLLWLHVV